MSNLLIKTSYDFHCHYDGFVIMTKEDYEIALDELEQAFVDDEFYIEVSIDNEFLSFESYSDIMEGIEVIELTDSEYTSFMEIFGDRYGLCTFDQIINGL